MVLCAIRQGSIIGPFFIENETGQTVTVNIDRYVDMLQRRFLPALRRKQDIIIFSHLPVRGWTTTYV